MPRSPIIPPSPDEQSYTAEEDQGEVFATGDPLALFAEWLARAGKSEINDPNAMALATVDADGVPDVRMVLLKEFNAEGLTFYTSVDSAKGRQLAGNSNAAVCFHWKSIRRQVRLRGTVAPVSAAEADAYFATRARTARIGAWASTQSAPLEGRFALERQVAARTIEFGLGAIPRPAHWSGYRLSPMRIEFWVNRPFRLHDRLEFTRAGRNKPWTDRRLYP